MALFKRGKLNSINTFWRSIIQSSLILITMFITISVYMSRYYDRTYWERLISSNISSLEHIKMMNENNLAQLYNITNQVAYSLEFTPFKLSEDALKGYRVKKHLSVFDITTGIFEKIFLLYDDDDYIYSTTTSIHIDMFLNEGFVCDTIADSLLQNLLRQKSMLTILPSQEISGIALYSATGNYVTFISPFGDTLGANSGTLVFLVKTDTYYSFFNHDPSDMRNTYIIYKNEPFASLCDNTVPYEAVAPYISFSGDSTIASIRHENKEYTLVALNGGMPDMVYATLVPTDVYLRISKSSQLPFWILMFVAAMLSLTLSTLFSRSNYLPVKNIRSMLGLDNASNDDFAAIQMGINKLIGANSDLINKLDDSLPSRRSDFTRSFLKGRYTSREECVRNAKISDMDIDKRFFAVMLAGFSHNPAFIDVTPALIASLNDSAVTGHGVELIAMEQVVFILFSDDMQQIISWIENSHTAWRSAGGTGNTATISASSVHSDFNMAAIAYFEANSAYDSRFIKGNDRVIYFPEISHIAQTPATYPHVSINSLSVAIDSGDHNALDMVLDELFGYFKTMDISLFTFRCIYNDIINVLMQKYLPSCDVDSLQMNDAFTLSRCLSIDDLDNLLRSTCVSLITSSTSKKQEGSALIRDICKYMHDHMTDINLSMASIAENFGLSTVKLSLDFKESMGMTPSEYLMMLRIDRAKELLVETDIPVKDICVTVGYIDVSGFIRRFKSRTALTPIQYRNAIRELHGPDNK